MTPNISFTGLSTFWGMLVMNGDSYNKLNDEQKKIFADAGAETMKKFEKYSKQNYDQLMKEVERTKATVYQWTPAEQEAHLDAIQPVINEITQKSGENGKKLIAALKKNQ